MDMSAPFTRRNLDKFRRICKRKHCSGKKKKTDQHVNGAVLGCFHLTSVGEKA